MRLTEEQIKTINNMNAGSQKVRLGNIIDEILANQEWFVNELKGKSENTSSFSDKNTDDKDAEEKKMKSTRGRTPKVTSEE